MQSHASETAIVRGYRMPPDDFIGVVHSVFDSVCSIDSNGGLVTLQDESHPMTPMAVAVRHAGGWSPRARRGDRARMHAGVISFAGHVFQVGALPVWSPAPPRAWVLPARGRAHQLALLRRARCEIESPADIRAIESDLAALCTLFAVRDALPDQAMVVSWVQRLIGAGPGLTPSGDDMLVGLLAALSRGGRHSGHATRMFARIGDAVLAHCGRTTDISAHYLRLAANHDFSEPLVALIDAVVASDHPDFLDAPVRAVLAIGATSGADALCGAINGLESTQRFQCPADAGTELEAAYGAPSADSTDTPPSASGDIAGEQADSNSAIDRCVG